MIKVIAIALTYAAVCLMPFLIGGCQTDITPETKAKIVAVDNEAAVKAAAAKAKAAADFEAAKATAEKAAEAGKDSPITHPIAAANNIVKQVMPFAVGLSVLAGVAWIILFALRFSAFSVIAAEFERPVRVVFILAVAITAALPWFPLGLGIVGVAFFGLCLYELIRAHFNLATTVADLKTDLGIKIAANAAGVAANAGAIAAPPAQAVTVNMPGAGSTTLNG